MREESAGSRKFAAMSVCVVLSLGLHLAVARLLMNTSGGHRPGMGAPFSFAVRPPHSLMLRVKKTQVPPAESLPPKQEHLPFAKTAPEHPQQAPQHADFIGERDSTQSAQAHAPDRRSDAPLPTMDGVERADEIVTFEQKRRDGALEEQAPAADTPAHAADGLARAEPPPPANAASAPPAAEAASAVAVQQETLPDATLQQHRQEPPLKPQPPVYDPSLPNGGAPPGRGFRTNEHITRSTGSFVLGSRPALNVAATPLGHYEDAVYRRVAAQWYRACDEHRGDIVPGTVTISVRIGSDGLLRSMQTVRCVGAGMIQQSFTFGAIRRAALPPMPAQVRRELRGDQLELLFSFNFE